MTDVLIIGAGAAGLMAAVTAADLGASVTVLEADRKPASKILRTGNGRCNFTNTGDVSGHYHGTDPAFAEQVLEQFSADDTIRMFRSFGILPYRNGDWIYPHSEQAADIANALISRAASLGVRIKNSERAVGIERNEQGFSVRTETWSYEAHTVIVCCGTEASLKPGSSVGLSTMPFHLNMKPYEPALCALTTSERKCKEWSGVRVHAALTLMVNGREVYRENGQIQFTKSGISGIAVFNAASPAREAMNCGACVQAVLDLVPDVPEPELADFLEEADASDMLRGIIPERLIPFVMKRQRSKHRDGAELAHILKNFILDINGTGTVESSQVAAGGVLTEQIDPDTMMVKTVPGLYMAGEMLDIDGECGGWNLQFAWAGGYLAGCAAASYSSKYT